MLCSHRLTLTIEQQFGSKRTVICSAIAVENLFLYSFLIHLNIRFDKTTKITEYRIRICFKSRHIRATESLPHDN